jgi:hypothetical protein
MTAAKVAVTLPADVLALAKRQVKAGHAKSLSALVTEAVGEKLRSNELRDILDEMDARLGKPGKEAQRWARRVLAR